MFGFSLTIKREAIMWIPVCIDKHPQQHVSSDITKSKCSMAEYKYTIGDLVHNVLTTHIQHV